MKARGYKTSTLLSATGVLAVVVAGVGWNLSSADGSGLQPTSVPQPSANQTLSPEKQAAAKAEEPYDEYLRRVGADDELRTSVVAEKEKLAAAHAAGGSEEGIGSMHPVPGIFDDHEAPMPAAELQCTNRWAGQIGENWYSVYAGAIGDDPSTGRVLILPDGAGDGAVVDLAGVGPLKIVSADSDELQIVDSSGNVHHLDVVHHTWRE